MGPTLHLDEIKKCHDLLVKDVNVKVQVQNVPEL